MDTSGGGPYTVIQESGTCHLPPSIPENAIIRNVLPINFNDFFTSKHVKFTS